MLKMNSSKFVAYGGIYTALCVVSLYLGGVISSLDALFWMLASVIIGMATERFGVKFSTAVYVASSAVCFMVVPSIFTSLSFAIYFGLIPNIFYFINKLSGVIKYIVMTGVNVVLTVIIYSLLINFYPPFFEGVPFPAFVMFVFFEVYYFVFRRLVRNMNIILGRIFRQY